MTNLLLLDTSLIVHSMQIFICKLLMESTGGNLEAHVGRHMYN